MLVHVLVLDQRSQCCCRKLYICVDYVYVLCAFISPFTCMRVTIQIIDAFYQISSSLYYMHRVVFECVRFNWFDMVYVSCLCFLRGKSDIIIIDTALWEYSNSTK